LSASVVLKMMEESGNFRSMGTRLKKKKKKPTKRKLEFYD
jgi:hypothetical protein